MNELSAITQDTSYVIAEIGKKSEMRATVVSSIKDINATWYKFNPTTKIEDKDRVSSENTIK